MMKEIVLDPKKIVILAVLETTSAVVKLVNNIVEALTLDPSFEE